MQLLNFNPSDNLIHILVRKTTQFHNQEDIALSDMRRVCYPAFVLHPELVLRNNVIQIHVQDIGGEALYFAILLYNFCVLLNLRYHIRTYRASTLVKANPFVTNLQPENTASGGEFGSTVKRREVVFVSVIIQNQFP